MQFCFKYSLEVGEWSFFFFFASHTLFFPPPTFSPPVLTLSCFKVVQFTYLLLLTSLGSKPRITLPPLPFFKPRYFRAWWSRESTCFILIKRLCLCTHSLRTIGCLKPLLSWWCFIFSFLQSGEPPSRPWLQELSIPGPIYLRALKSLLLHGNKFQT